ncbi:MAG: replicative DNA helicase [Acidobacteria bacterium]|nr:replicative DNA helicase [Acidobacteriota bacterium]|tara:strand:+ start:379 stop:1728 length:1350 start_codon:yes stop_codon:yes gene_type:complete
MAESVSPAISERSLPQNLEAERCVLGAILIQNDNFNQAAELIDADDFFRDAHRRVFDKMVDLNERGEAIDLVTLKDELGRSNDLERVGGAAYIASLVDGVPRSTHVEHYAQIIKEKSTLRNLISSANRILDTAYRAQDESASVLDEAERAIFSIADQNIHAGFVPLRDLVQDSFKKIEEVQSHKDLVTGVPSGFVNLDKLTSGFQASDLVILAARPSMGKTAFALNIAQHIGTKINATVGIFSLEMSKDQLFMRMLTTEAGIDSHRFRGGFLGERDYGELSAAMSRLSEAKVFIDDSASIGVLEMRAKARRLKSEHGLDLIVVDYLQLMQGRGRFDNRTQELASISRSLKGLAKELEVPVIALSQLSRAPENRSDRRPQLSDLRESGALEQDADLVMFIYREEQYDPSPENENLAEIIIGKQRNGPTGVVKLAFLKQCTKFANLTSDYE